MVVVGSGRDVCAEAADLCLRRAEPSYGLPWRPAGGRVAIVTGGEGLGTATVRALRHAGATVVPVDVHGDDCLIADAATAEGNR